MEGIEALKKAGLPIGKVLPVTNSASLDAFVARQLDAEEIFENTDPVDALKIEQLVRLGKDYTEQLLLKDGSRITVRQLTRVQVKEALLLGLKKVRGTEFIEIFWRNSRKKDEKNLEDFTDDDLPDYNIFKLEEERWLVYYSVKDTKLFRGKKPEEIIDLIERIECFDDLVEKIRDLNGISDKGYKNVQSFR